MRAFSPFGSFLVAATAVALLAGCSGGISQTPTSTGALSPQSRSIASKASPAHPPGFVNVAGVNAPSGNQIIVADSANDTVSVYGAHGQLNGLLTAGLNRPDGLATDAAENLYVANTQDFNVLVYAKPYTSAPLTLNDPGLYPTGVAVSQTGIVAVTNDVANPYGPGGVRFYAKGSATACATVTDPNWHGMFFGAFDASGNLFFDGDDSNGNSLYGEISGGCAATSVTTLSIGNTLYNPQAVQVSNGKILILDQDYASFSPVIYTYAPPSGGSLGSPVATTKLSAGIEMQNFAMTKGGRDLWIVHSDAAAGRIEYTYPGGRFVKSFNQSSLGTATGIAVNPAAAP
jgi:hypothetical protein